MRFRFVPYILAEQDPVLAELLSFNNVVLTGHQVCHLEKKLLTRSMKVVPVTLFRLLSQIFVSLRLMGNPQLRNCPIRHAPYYNRFRLQTLGHGV